MATVELRPGDSLNIIWTSVQDTPLGKQEVESSFAFTYDDLLQRLQASSTGKKSKKSGTDGARFSRVVALACNALLKGKWSTGADIEREEVFERLMRRFEKLPDTEYRNITNNARIALSDLAHRESILTASQRKILADVVAAIG